MSNMRQRILDMMYPIYGFRLNEDEEDTPSQSIERMDVNLGFVTQMSAHGPPHIYGARGKTLAKKCIL